jgi:uncharacterized protein (DUF58 family)
MISKDLLARVRKIEIRTRRMVDEITAGAYHSVFKGAGIEFDEVREYTSDDDVKDIDWNVTARMGHPYVKKYVEERELTVMLLVDASASGHFGSGDKTKNEVAAEIASLLAFSAIRNNDKVGLLLFTDRTELYLPPKSGRHHGLRLIREVLARKPEGRGTDISGALENMVKILNKKAVIFLISDLIDDSGSYKKLLTVANKRHDIIAVRILDPKELDFPKIPGLSIVDAESNASGYFSGSGKAAAQYSEKVKKLHQENKETCMKAKVDMIDIRSDEDLVKPLMTFFRQREKLVRKA